MGDKNAIKDQYIELWKPCNGFEGIYEVSNTGKVKALEKLVGFRNRYGGMCVRNEKEKMLLLETTRAGYNRVVLCNKGVKFRVTVHRLVLANFEPNVNNLPHVNHKDGNKQNNCLSNLEWCSVEYNQQHAFDNHLNCGLKGRMNITSKPVVAFFMGKKYNEYESMGLANIDIGISRSTILRSIINERTIRLGKYKGFKFEFK